MKLDSIQKQKLIGFSAMGLSVIFTLVLVLAPLASPLPMGAKFDVQPAVLSAGAKGGINRIEVHQYSGGWILRGVVYSTGGSITVVADLTTRFTCRVFLGWDIGGSSESTALLYSKSLITIAGEGITNAEMTGETVIQTIPDVGRYIDAVYDWSDSGKPVAGTTYTITIDFQAYY